MLKLVIFDMDGLMYDTEGLAMECGKKAAAKYGYVIDEDFALSSIGMNASDYRKMVKEKFGNDYPYELISKESRQTRMTYLRKHGMKIKPGLKELLSYLQENEIKIALASSSAKETIDEYNCLAGLDNVFDYIIAGNNVEHSKPNPEIFLKVIEHFNVNKDETIILEDSRNGILAAHNAGIPVICVPDLVKHSQDILDMTYATLPSLHEVIKEIMILRGEN